MRKYGWEDFALPLMLIFAVTFALTLHHQIWLPNPAAPAVAATEMQPSYVMTITAKRLPAECRGAGAHDAHCASYMTGDARIEVHERGATQIAQGPYAY